MSGFLNMLGSDMLFVHLATEVECVRRMRKMLQMDISSESNIADLFPFCLPRPLSCLYPTREVDV